MGIERSKINIYTVAQSVSSLDTSVSEKASLSGATFTGEVDVVSASAVGSSSTRQITFSTSAPTGGNNGDVWLVYS